MFYGLLGMGKSYLVKVVVIEVKSMFFSISSFDLVSKWMGESERYVFYYFLFLEEEVVC